MNRNPLTLTVNTGKEGVIVLCQECNRQGMINGKYIFNIWYTSRSVCIGLRPYNLLFHVAQIECKSVHGWFLKKTTKRLKWTIIWLLTFTARVWQKVPRRELASPCTACSRKTVSDHSTSKCRLIRWLHAKLELDWIMGRYISRIYPVVGRIKQRQSSWRF